MSVQYDEANDTYNNIHLLAVYQIRTHEFETFWFILRGATTQVVDYKFISCKSDWLENLSPDANLSDNSLR